MVAMTGSLQLRAYPSEIVRLSFDKCGRAGQYRKQNLIDRYGADIRPELCCFTTPNNVLKLPYFEQCELRPRWQRRLIVGGVEQCPRTKNNQTYNDYVPHEHSVTLQPARWQS